MAITKTDTIETQKAFFLNIGILIFVISTCCGKIFSSVVALSFFVIGHPQLGQKFSSSEISLPHSSHTKTFKLSSSFFSELAFVNSNPHCGQKDALSLISLPHCGQLISAINIPPLYNTNLIF